MCACINYVRVYVRMYICVLSQVKALRRAVVWLSRSSPPDCQVSRHTHMHACTHAHTHTRTHTQHTHTHTHTHTRTHTHTHTHTHAHTSSKQHSNSFHEIFAEVCCMCVGMLLYVACVYLLCFCVGIISC